MGNGKKDKHNMKIHQASRPPRPGATSWLAATIIGVCLTFVAVGCGGEPDEKKPVARPVKITTIGESSGGDWREYPGTIKAAQNAYLGFEVAGRIIARPVKEGEKVKKGTVLARLDDRDYVAQLDVAKANLRKAQTDYQRGQNIYKEDPGAISKQRIDLYRRTAEVAQAELQVAEKALQDTRLRAPFDGVMARKLVDDFANVNPKDPVLVFQDTSHLEIQINIPERDMGRDRPQETGAEITARLKPEVVVTSIPNRAFPARVKEMTTTAEPETRTFQATLIFENPEDAGVFPGMTAKVRVKASRIPGFSDTIAVPVNAVTDDESGRPFVWLIDPSSMTVRRAPVQLGEMFGSDIEIRQGLSRGDMIATSGVQALREGMPVRKLVRQVAQ